MIFQKFLLANSRNLQIQIHSGSVSANDTELVLGKRPGGKGAITVFRLTLQTKSCNSTMRLAVYYNEISSTKNLNNKQNFIYQKFHGKHRVVCPNFGHPVLTSSFTNRNF